MTQAKGNQPAVYTNIRKTRDILKNAKRCMEAFECKGYGIGYQTNHSKGVKDIKQRLIKSIILSITPSPNSERPIAGRSSTRTFILRHHD